MAAREREQCRRLDFERSQNIALLSLLTKNPTPAGVNRCPPHISNQKKGQTLAFSRESHLAEAIAFISGVSDSPDHVVAIALEEQAPGGGLRVLVAINRSTYANPTDERVLGRIKSGLDAVFRLLARAKKKNNENKLEEQVTDAIIDLCRDRILARIRSQRSDVSRSFFTKARKFTGSNLENILSAVRRHSFNAQVASRSDIERFTSQTEKLLEILHKVESSESRRVNVALKELVVTACSLHRGRRAVNIAGILDDLTNVELNPGDSVWFKIWIRKLSRYRECSGYLFRTARKTSLFNKVRVVPVSLTQGCFSRQGETAKETCLANCITRCRREDPQCSRAQAEDGIAALTDLGRDDFLPAFTKILKDSRIHAEIQIIAHYELHPAKYPPRIIKSSKDACYLCHMFIKEHGKFFTPRTHGRLYNGWRLPSNLVGFNTAQTKLNRSLQARIWEGGLDYAQTNRVRLVISVNESDVGSLSSMSSLGSFGLLTERTSLVVGKPNPGVEFVSLDDVSTSEIPAGEGQSLPGGASKKGKGKNKLEVKGSILQVLEPVEEENSAVEVPPPHEVESLSKVHSQARLPLQSGEISDNEPSEENNTPDQALPPGEITSTPVATVTTTGLDVVESDSSQSSSEDSGQNQDPLPQEEVDDDDLMGTAQTSPDPEPETNQAYGLPFETHEAGLTTQSQSRPEHEPDRKRELEPSASPPEKVSPTSSHNDHNLLPSLDPKSKPEIPHASMSSRARSNPQPIRDLTEDSEYEDDHQVSEVSEVSEDSESEDDQETNTEIILTQGKPSTFLLSDQQGPRPRKRIPSYRNGKKGKLVLHPEYIITKTRTSKTATPSGSEKSIARIEEDRRETVELRIIWLFPSTLSSPSSLSQPSQHRHEFEDTVAGTCVNRPTRKIPDFLAETLPTQEDLDTGSTDRVRLVDRDGEVVLVEVVRTRATGPGNTYLP